MRVEVAVTLTADDKAMLAAIFAAGVNGGNYQTQTSDWVVLTRLRQLELVRSDDGHAFAFLTVAGHNIARRIVAEAAGQPRSADGRFVA